MYRLRAKRFAMGLAVLTAAMGLLLSGTQSVAATFRAVPSADVKYLDPHFTTADITLTYSYLVYDTLFGLDAKGEPQPQMVDKYDVSPDRLTYTFTLRKGLQWHDGKPVTSKDVVASLKRWGSKDSAGQRLLARTVSLEAVNDATFRLKLKEPYGLVLRSLAKPYSYIPFILPERHATQSADKPFEGDPVGSGPYTFSKAEWVPGSKMIFHKFKDYVPRSEPASGTAGAKNVYVDQVEWVIIPDPATAAAALDRGEVDYLEVPFKDLLDQMRADPRMHVFPAARYYRTIHPNKLIPPFDNVKARQALAYLVSVPDILRAVAGDPKNWEACYKFLGCSGWLSDVDEIPGLRGQDYEKAAQLMKEAGYKGEKVVLMGATEMQANYAISVTLASQIRKAGINVDFQTMDWGTLVSRRGIKEAPGPGNPGGWHIFTTGAGTTPAEDPWGYADIQTTCEKAWYGWSCSPKTTADLEQLGKDVGTPRFKESARRYHADLNEYLPYIPVGVYNAYRVYRKDVVSGIIENEYSLYWNIRKSK